MVRKNNDFRLYLTSRVPGVGNQPGEFTTQFAAPLELEGAEWEVGIESLHYLHSWFDIYKDMSLAVLLRDPACRRPSILQRLQMYTLDTVPIDESELIDELKTPLESYFMQWNSEKRANHLPILEYSWHYDHNRQNLLKWLNEITDRELTRVLRHDRDDACETQFEKSLIEYRKVKRLWGYVINHSKITKCNIQTPELLCTRVNRDNRKRSTI